MVGGSRSQDRCPDASPRRDGPDQSAPQLGVFSGNTALETAYSSSSRVLLKFHSDFSNGGFFVLNFHGERTAAPPARAGAARDPGPASRCWHAPGPELAS